MIKGQRTKETRDTPFSWQYVKPEWLKSIYNRTLISALNTRTCSSVIVWTKKIQPNQTAHIWSKRPNWSTSPIANPYVGRKWGFGRPRTTFFYLSFLFFFSPIICIWWNNMRRVVVLQGKWGSKTDVSGHVWAKLSNCICRSSNQATQSKQRNAYT